MPNVPVYNPQGTVKDAGLPSARVSTNAPVEAFGADYKTPQALSRFNAGIQKIILAEKARADKTHVKSLYDTATQKKLDLTSTYQNLQGKDAVSAFDDYETKWKDVEGEIRGEVKNQAQQMAVDDILSRMKSEYMGTLHRHTSIQNRAYEDQVSQSLTNTLIKDGISGAAFPDKVKQVSDDLRRNIIDILDKKGLAEAEVDEDSRKKNSRNPVVKEMLQNVQGKLHHGVIGKMIEMNQLELAREHYHQNKKFMSASSAESAKKAIDSASLLGKVQQNVDSIMAQGLTQKEAFDKARDIDDPRERKETQTLLDHTFIRVGRHEDAAAEKLFQFAADAVEKGSRPKSGVWDLLSLSNRTALDRRLEQVLRGVEPSTNWERYYDLEQMASMPNKRAKFLKLRLPKYRHELANAEFKKISALQAAARRGDEKFQFEIDGIQTKNAIVQGAVKALDIDKNNKLSALFKQRVDVEVVLRMQATGKKQTNEDIQNIVDTLTKKVKTSEGWLWDSTEAAYKVDIDDISVADQATIATHLRNKGLPATEDNILAVYIRGKQSGE